MSIVTFSRLGKMGRLGNCLFEIASTIGLARANKKDAYFPIWNYGVYFENGLPNLEQYHEKSLDYQGYKIVREADFSYKHLDLSDRSFNYDLMGYFQSEKYFKDCKEEIRNTFSLLPVLRKIIHENNPILNHDDITLVSLHVRRGDYLDLEEYHTNLIKTDYYKKAVNFVKTLTNGTTKAKMFLLFSDDMYFTERWFKESFPNCNYIPINEKSDIKSLYVMSKCKYHIMANSSFSWWGSWLSDHANKLVVTPAKWFGPKGPTKHDLYYPGTMLMP